MAQAATHVVVLGAGVLGLSIALSLMDSPAPLSITLVSHEFPTTRSPTAEYASTQAGAHHVSAAVSEREEMWDRRSLEVFRRLESSGSEGWPWSRKSKESRRPLLCVRQLELFTHDPNSDARQRAQQVLAMYENYAHADQPGTFPAGDAWATVFRHADQLSWQRAYAFDTVDIDVPQYLLALFERFLDLGGRSISAPGKLDSIDSALRLASQHLPAAWEAPSGIVVAAGLGAVHLRELADDASNLYPVRGETLLVNAPWLNLGDSQKVPGVSRTNENGERDLYLIPRLGGHYIVGGTRISHDADPTPRAHTTKEILERALLLCPGLVAPERRNAHGGRARVEDVEVVGQYVGLRPARYGGPILEKCHMAESALANAVKVVVAYGFGGHGYQSSWGAAFEARDLMLKNLGLPIFGGQVTLSSLDLRREKDCNSLKT